MSIEVTQEIISQVEEKDVWEPPMPPTDLIFDDGEPLESNRHRIAMNVLIRSFQQANANRNDFFTGGNMFIYYSSTQARNRDFKGPDFFVVLDVDGTQERQGWVVWEESGRYPDAVVELMSPSTAEKDKTTKKTIYERTFKTPDYFIYDPFDSTSLQGWHLDANQRYEEIIPDERGWLWCQSLGLWLGTWEGTIDRENAVWLRFYDVEGNLLPLPEEAEKQRADEAAQQADNERQRAEAESQRAEAESQRAEAESQRAEAESQRAEAESQRAEAESQRAEAESQRAEAESQRAEILAAQLRALGVEPNM